MDSAIVRYILKQKWYWCELKLNDDGGERVNIVDLHWEGTRLICGNNNLLHINIGLTAARTKVTKVKGAKAGLGVFLAQTSHEQQQQELQVCCLVTDL